MIIKSMIKQLFFFSIILYSTLLFIQCSTDNTMKLSDENEIINFMFYDFINDVVIDGDTISVYIYEDVPLDSLTPIITYSDKANIFPKSGENVNFEEEVMYTVTSESGKKHYYMVQINKILPPIKEQIAFEMDFERDSHFLIKNITIICNNLTEEDKQPIVESIIIVPEFVYEIEYEGVKLIITPKDELDELTRYTLLIGDDQVIDQQSFSFITAPYHYLTTELVISPQFWLSDEKIRINSQGQIEADYGPIIGWQRNFVTMAQFALACFDDYIDSQNQESLDLFILEADYFLSNYNVIDGNIAYPYLFSYYELLATWYSGLAQGQIVSVLVRAYILTNNSKYLNFAINIINFMLLPVERGGVLTYTPEGFPWIEEYPTNPQSLVWNGFVFAVMGLIDFNKVAPSEILTQYIDSFIYSLKNTVDFYDTGSSLLYGRKVRYNYDIDLRYTGIHTFQALHLYKATEDPFFYDLYLKWSSYFNYADFIALYH